MAINALRAAIKKIKATVATAKSTCDELVKTQKQLEESLDALIQRECDLALREERIPLPRDPDNPALDLAARDMHPSGSSGADAFKHVPAGEALEAVDVNRPLRPQGLETSTDAPIPLPVYGILLFQMNRPAAVTIYFVSTAYRLSPAAICARTALTRLSLSAHAVKNLENPPRFLVFDLPAGATFQGNNYDLKELRKSRKGGSQCVSKWWFLDCLDQGRVVCADRYEYASVIDNGSPVLVVNWHYIKTCERLGYLLVAEHNWGGMRLFWPSHRYLFPARLAGTAPAAIALVLPARPPPARPRLDPVAAPGPPPARPPTPTFAEMLQAEDNERREQNDYARTRDAFMRSMEVRVAAVRSRPEPSSQTKKKMDEKDCPATPDGQAFMAGTDVEGGEDAKMV
ncbi:uncharacterized protein EHS24_002249 [Apiotrichum porosum]|uniref:Uncharacterized protein n=1 Tax=Apiotrichum porosum TaxID=105984 RepID=A0A427XIF0_9TREE|nr:uncharacterized protein EHS24_002249 [Apiotrichum porosum]RSH78524.1 hypothetical protein EHS24_002249 [Apiotrichum porosum]